MEKRIKVYGELIDYNTSAETGFVLIIAPFAMRGQKSFLLPKNIVDPEQKRLLLSRGQNLNGALLSGNIYPNTSTEICEVIFDEEQQLSATVKNSLEVVITKGLRNISIPPTDEILEVSQPVVIIVKLHELSELHPKASHVTALRSEGVEKAVIHTVWGQEPYSLIARFGEFIDFNEKDVITPDGICPFLYTGDVIHVEDFFQVNSEVLFYRSGERIIVFTWNPFEFEVQPGVPFYHLLTETLKIVDIDCSDDDSAIDETVQVRSSSIWESTSISSMREISLPRQICNCTEEIPYEVRPDPFWSHQKLQQHRRSADCHGCIRPIDNNGYFYPA